MKYVYVLTSTEKDLYYEQCLMSVFSLRHYMPKAFISIITDNKTNETFNNRLELKNYVNEIISVPFNDTVSNIERSRRLKTTIPEYINDSFLFIDCDTIVCDNLSEIENSNYDIAAVLDGHVKLDEHKHKEYFLKREKKIGYQGTKYNNYHVNSGIIYFKNTEKSKLFFKKWNELWENNFNKYHDHHDQGPFNEALYQCNIKDCLLNGEWNCQISQGGLAYLQNAKIIHYFSSEFAGKNYVPYYKLADKKLQNEIKETGVIPDNIRELILNPKFQFNKVHLLNDQRIINIIQSPMILTYADIKTKCPLLFKILECPFTLLRKLLKKIVKK